MDVLMNGLLLAATLFAGGYCWVLARRVRDLKSLDRGLGGAIVTLTRQIFGLLPVFWLLSLIGLNYTWLAFPVAETAAGAQRRE